MRSCSLQCLKQALLQAKRWTWQQELMLDGIPDGMLIASTTIHLLIPLQSQLHVKELRYQGNHQQL